MQDNDKISCMNLQLETTQHLIYELKRGSVHHHHNLTQLQLLKTAKVALAKLLEPIRTNCF